MNYAMQDIIIITIYSSSFKMFTRNLPVCQDYYGNYYLR